jgi:hypothetical protein
MADDKHLTLQGSDRLGERKGDVHAVLREAVQMLELGVAHDGVVGRHGVFGSEEAVDEFEESSSFSAGEVVEGHLGEKDAYSSIRMLIRVLHRLEYDLIPTSLSDLLPALHRLLESWHTRHLGESALHGQEVLCDVLPRVQTVILELHVEAEAVFCAVGDQWRGTLLVG